MDPQANLQEQREIANRLLNPVEDEAGFRNTRDRIVDAERLAELVIALDEWRTGGGFDPYTA